MPTKRPSEPVDDAANSKTVQNDELIKNDGGAQDDCLSGNPETSHDGTSEASHAIISGVEQTKKLSQERMESVMGVQTYLRMLLEMAEPSRTSKKKAKKRKSKKWGKELEIIDRAEAEVVASSSSSSSTAPVVVAEVGAAVAANPFFFYKEDQNSDIMSMSNTSSESENNMATLFERVPGLHAALLGNVGDAIEALDNNISNEDLATLRDALYSEVWKKVEEKEEWKEAFKEELAKSEHFNLAFLTEKTKHEDTRQMLRGVLTLLHHEPNLQSDYLKAMPLKRQKHRS